MCVVGRWGGRVAFTDMGECMKGCQVSSPIDKFVMGVMNLYTAYAVDGWSYIVNKLNGK